MPAYKDSVTGTWFSSIVRAGQEKTDKSRNEDLQRREKRWSLNEIIKLGKSVIWI